MHMKYTHLPISFLDLSNWSEPHRRSKLLGTFEEQQHRIARIIYLITEIPEPPAFRKQTLLKNYSYEELHRFEKGE